MNVDVVIVGGGPAGSVCATRLAQRGRRVVVLERERHPRFHLGESLLPNSLQVLDDIGVLPTVRERFIVKRGARFVDGADDTRAVRYAFAESFQPRWDHAFQVPREDFDEILFRHATAAGADTREGWEVTRVITEHGRAAGVCARGPDSLVAGRSATDGAEHEIRARFVVDATGRDAMLARSQSSVQRIPNLDRTALFAQVDRAWRDSGDREGDIQIIVFGEGEGRGWFWLIPFADGRSSVGAVVSGAWIRERRALGGPEALFAAAVAEAPALGRMLEGSKFLFAPRAAADFSFRVRTVRGEGWISLGDAAGFIDPLFSTGAHLAMVAALKAADEIDAGLEDGNLGTDRFAQWEADLRAGADLFVGAVQAFYTGDLTTYLFAHPQHPFLRRAITSMLSGDVFDTKARWAREMRSRFPARWAD
jgi:flavin-dependent dehydrogenase